MVIRQKCSIAVLQDRRTVWRKPMSWRSGLRGCACSHFYLPFLLTQRFSQTPTARSPTSLKTPPNRWNRSWRRAEHRGKASCPCTAHNTAAIIATLSTSIGLFPLDSYRRLLRKIDTSSSLMNGCRLANLLNTASDSTRRKISTETETIKKRNSPYISWQNTSIYRHVYECYILYSIVACKSSREFKSFAAISDCNEGFVSQFLLTRVQWQLQVVKARRGMWNLWNTRQL